MPDSIWSSTLGTFRERLESVEPVPAGVTAIAVGAVFACSLLAKVFAIASRHKDFAGEQGFVEALIREASERAATLARLADEDAAAFANYLECMREKRPIEAALRGTIEVPLKIAREAAAGVELSHKGKDMVHAIIKPDLAIARSILAGAVNATLFTLEANLEQLPSGDPFREEVTAEARQVLQSIETFMPLSQPSRSDR